MTPKLSHLRIIGQRFRLEWIDEKESMRRNERGLWEGDENVITVCHAMPPPRVAETLWHEMKHEMSDLMGLPKSAMKEKVIRRMARGEIAMLADNPQLLDWLKAMLHGEGK